MELFHERIVLVTTLHESNILRSSLAISKVRASSRKTSSPFKLSNTFNTPTCHKNANRNIAINVNITFGIKVALPFRYICRNGDSQFRMKIKSDSVILFGSNCNRKITAGNRRQTTKIFARYCRKRKNDPPNMPIRCLSNCPTEEMARGKMRNKFFIE